MWQHLPDLRPVSDDQFGAYQDGRQLRRSSPLALTQLLIAYHLLAEVQRPFQLPFAPPVAALSRLGAVRASPSRSARPRPLPSVNAERPPCNGRPRYSSPGRASPGYPPIDDVGNQRRSDDDPPGLAGRGGVLLGKMNFRNGGSGANRRKSGVCNTGKESLSPRRRHRLPRPRRYRSKHPHPRFRPLRAANMVPFPAATAAKRTSFTARAS